MYTVLICLQTKPVTEFTMSSNLQLNQLYKKQERPSSSRSIQAISPEVPIIPEKSFVSILPEHLMDLIHQIGERLRHVTDPPFSTVQSFQTLLSSSKC